MEERKVSYHVGEQEFESVLCTPRERDGRLPAILVCHAFHGVTEFELGKTRALAEMGYVAMAVDVYGKGVKGEDREACFALMRPLVDDRPGKLRERLLAAYEQVKALEYVDSNKIGAIGFCFGGLCVLDLARWNVGLRLAVSFHGLLKPIPDLALDHISAIVQVFHGDDDRAITEENVSQFMAEMRKRKADWHVVIYGNAGHAFTVPGSEKMCVPGVGYNAEADRRSWATMKEVLDEVLK